jgi:hypothetical protein
MRAIDPSHKIFIIVGIIGHFSRFLMHCSPQQSTRTRVLRPFRISRQTVQRPTVTSKVLFFPVRLPREPLLFCELAFPFVFYHFLLFSFVLYIMQAASDSNWLKYLTNENEQNGNTDATWEINAPKYVDFSNLEQAETAIDQFFNTRLESPDTSVVSKSRKSLSGLKRKV